MNELWEKPRRSNRPILTKQTQVDVTKTPFHARALQSRAFYVGQESSVNMLAYVNHALIGRVDEGLGSDIHSSTGSELNIHESVYLNFRRWRGNV